VVVGATVVEVVLVVVGAIVVVVVVVVVDVVVDVDVVVVVDVVDVDVVVVCSSVVVVCIEPTPSKPWPAQNSNALKHWRLWARSTRPHRTWRSQMQRQCNKFCKARSFSQL